VWLGNCGQVYKLFGEGNNEQVHTDTVQMRRV